ncbi:hypothetical protein [Halovivax limisalsi]|uniref:hypothetical protein n=1 Tax=Halovivax limisalsi TaxID=1453760 RepID=UPI001FFCE40F|nr:hypothetical protein [Halovivax limisalsi]
MRILLIPEVYRRDDLSANGTVNDAIAWVSAWLDRDPRVHVYWLLPPREAADYDAADVHADRERVTLLEAEPAGAELEPTAMFTEGGYSDAELQAIEREIYEPGGFVDVVVDGRRVGRRTLVKWLLERVDQWAARVRPFDVVANVHDLQIPRKYRYCSYRNAYQGRMELCEIALADGAWFTAPVDAREFREHAADFLRPDVLEATLDRSRVIYSPVEFDRFEETYPDEPEWLHVAGSLWEKKRADVVFDVAETLRERFGIRTLVTSVEDLPARYAEREWVEARPRADRETYERALARGDLAICASEYETLARTWFEQAASGQVLCLRDEPWVYDCVPDDHPLVGPIEDLESLVVRAVERWDDAVAANRSLVEHLRTVRSPERVGARTHEDLRRRIDSKVQRYSPGDSAADGERVETDGDGLGSESGCGGAVSRVAAAMHRIDGDRIALDELLDRIPGTAGLERDEPYSAVSTVDAINALRALGWADAADPGTPTFVRTSRGF